MKMHQYDNEPGLQQETERFWLEIIQIICIIQSGLRLLQLIRYDDRFCFLVEMLI